MITERSELEDILRQNNAGSFIDAVSDNLNNDADYLLLSLYAFHNEPDLLYTALAYASSRGVAVLMAPEHAAESTTKD